MTEKEATDWAPAVSRKNWSREKVVEELQGLSMQLGHTPRVSDAPAPLSAAAIAHFGSWNEAKRAAGLEACSKGPKRTKRTNSITCLRAIAEGLQRLDVAIEEIAKLEKDEVQTDSTRYPSLRGICRDLNWLKIRLGLLMIRFPELAEREEFALGTKPPGENARGPELNPASFTKPSESIS